MKDLKIRYKNENGEVNEREYDTVMDFIDEMESDADGRPNLDYEVIRYMFFENPLNAGNETTIAWLLEHCRKIIK